jgi:hypothetical protein
MIREGVQLPMSLPALGTGGHDFGLSPLVNRFCGHLHGGVWEFRIIKNIPMTVCLLLELATRGCDYVHSSTGTPVTFHLSRCAKLA